MTFDQQDRLSSLVNLDDPRQDVHRERRHSPSLHRYSIAERLLPPSLEGLRVLELGGGIAELARRMVHKGAVVSMTDLSPVNVERAISYGIDARLGDLNEGLGGYPDQLFDGVVMLEIIEHVVAAEQLLREVNRVVRPGGFLILSTPNFAFILNRLRILFGRLSVDEGYHYRFFTKRVLEDRLGSAGFRIDARAHTSPAIGVNIVRNRMLGLPRMHIGIPGVLASMFAQTLFVRASKSADGNDSGRPERRDSGGGPASV